MKYHDISGYFIQMTKPVAHKASTNLESYSFYVVDKLIGIKGTGVSDVLSFIVKQWISDHREELVQYGILVQAWEQWRNSGG
jgi:hypothetical protein